MRVVPMAAILLAGMLSGCAVPPIMLAASVLGDGALTVTTGKGSTEHLVSAVTGKDCVTGRMLKGENMCRDEQQPSDTAATAPAPVEAPAEIAAPAAVEATPVVVAPIEVKTAQTIKNHHHHARRVAHHHHAHKHLAHGHQPHKNAAPSASDGQSVHSAPARS